ncbi:MAG: hypothetical protein HRU23_02580 [Gammaproteobacteria bacterium]|nr:hypothetical protein [Gammaproteobacteria bacterium]
MWQWILSHLSWHKRTRWYFAIAQYITVALIIALSLFSQRLSFNADILALLPQTQQSQLVASGEKYFFDQSRSQIVLSFSTISIGNNSTGKNSTGKNSTGKESIGKNSTGKSTGGNSVLAHDQMVEFFKQQHYQLGGAIAPSIADVAAFYHDHNGAILSDFYQNNLTNGQAILDHALQALSQAADPFVSSSFSLDPSLNLALFIKERLTGLSSLGQQQGRFVTQSNGQSVYLLFVTLPPEQLGIKAAQVVSKQIINQISALTSQYPDVVITHSGFVFHTAENSQQAEFEMSVFGGISMLLLALMVWLVFRSLKPLVLTSLTVLNALLFGFAAICSVFSSIHLLSLVFAVTLIGIAIDYCFHILTDIGFAQGRDNNLSPSVVNALLFGCVTTVVGYALLLGSPLELLSQVAVFVIFGLVGALLFVVVIAPLFLSTEKIKPTQSSLLLVARVQGALIWLNAHRKLTIVITIALISSALWFKPLTFNDDIRLLNASSAALMQNERINLQRLGKIDQSRFYITAADFEQLMVREEQLIAQIKQLQPGAKIDALSQWLPSIKQQKINDARLRQAQKDQLFGPLSAVLNLPVTIPAPKLLTETLAFSSPLNALFVTKIAKTEQGYVSWLSVEGLAPAHIAALVDPAMPNVFFIDKATDISASLQTYRSEIIGLQCLSLLLVLVLFTLKYGLKIALKQIGVLLLAAAVALVSASWIGGALNIFNMLALLLVIALGIDYLIFYQSQGLSHKNVLAILLSAISSMLVFGMLAMSKTPAVFSFGITVMCGIIAVYFIAPLSITINKNKL